MRVECGFFFFSVKKLRGWLKKVCKKFRKSIAVLNLLVIFANEIKTRSKMKTNNTLIPNEIFNRIVYAGYKMVMEGANISLAVASLSRTNGLNPYESVKLMNAIKAEL